ARCWSRRTPPPAALRPGPACRRAARTRSPSRRSSWWTRSSSPPPTRACSAPPTEAGAGARPAWTSIVWPIWSGWGRSCTRRPTTASTGARTPARVGRLSRRVPGSSPGAAARRRCDRHTGVGADGVLVYELQPPAAVRMRLINADGSDAEISGNGVRCLAAYMVRKGLLPARHVVETVPGPRPVEVFAIAAGRYRVATDLGAPALASAAIPVEVSAPRETVIGEALQPRGR